MKKLIVLLFVALTVFTHAAKKNEKKLQPVKLDIKISNLGIEPGVVYVFTDKGVASSFKNYGQKCLSYKRKNPKLYKKYKEKLAKLLTDKAGKVIAIKKDLAKLLLVRWNSSICQVEFTRQVEVSSGQFSNEKQLGYLATLDTYKNPASYGGGKGGGKGC